MTPADTHRRPDWRVSAPGLLLLAGGALYIAEATGTKPAWLFLLGGSLGLVFYHAAFGFASAWRAFVAEGRGAGLRAQMFMLGLATLLFFPLLDAGTVLDQPLVGAVAPLALGGLLMGYGARLAFGCNVGAYFSGIASGSLHGWLWFVAALAGSYLGSRLRPLFGLGAPLAAPSKPLVA